MRKPTLAFLLATTLLLAVPATAADAPPEVGPIVDLRDVVEVLFGWLGLETEDPDPPEGPPTADPVSPESDDGEDPSTEVGPIIEPHG